jgi:hypothetical protein
MNAFLMTAQALTGTQPFSSWRSYSKPQPKRKAGDAPLPRPSTRSCLGFTRSYSSETLKAWQRKAEVHEPDDPPLSGLRLGGEDALGSAVLRPERRQGAFGAAFTDSTSGIEGFVPYFPGAGGAFRQVIAFHGEVAGESFREFDA